MVQNNNLVPVTMAVLLHVMLFSSMIVAFNLSRPVPITPMAIHATLVTEVPEVDPPAVRQKEPEPVVEEPEPEPEPEPELDNSEELRLQAEEQKRVQDALIEKERLEKMRQQKEADDLKKAREEVQRKKDEEAKKERERQEAERKRKEDEERQRKENERIRKELEAKQRSEEIAAEESRLASVNSGELAVYIEMIRQRVYRSWSPPASAKSDLLCPVSVRQAPGGQVTGVKILPSCNGDEAVKRSIEAAIYKSSPLPQPSNPALFERDILLNMTLQ